MENITYLIGAGASYHSLPLIKTMSERMKAFSIFLSIYYENGIIKNSFAQQFINDLNQLIAIEKNRTSIDTYAKELFEKGSTIELVRLKAILCSYLAFEQFAKPSELKLLSDKFDHNFLPPPRLPLDSGLDEMIRTNIDKRYFAFWATYLSNRSDKLPKNIKIISWNYDQQFEASYSNIKNCSLELTQQYLQIYPSTIQSIDASNSCVLKLNGTAGLIANHNSKKYNLFDFRKDGVIANLDMLINILKENYDRTFQNPLFSFAWETDEPLVIEARKQAKNIISETSVLVVIGYSFPDFNRIVDREIFQNVPNLKKVYFQAPQSEIEVLKYKLDGVNQTLSQLFHPITNLDSFHVPNEYWSS